MQFPMPHKIAITALGGATIRMSDSFLDRFHAEAGDVLTSIFAHSCDCIKLLTLEGELEYVSDSARDALGLASAQDAVGRNWLSMWSDDQRPRLREALAQSAQGRSARFEGTTGSGLETRHWEVALSPVRGVGDAITHLLAVSTETTTYFDAARLERERREQAEREIAYAATVARELRHRLKNQLAVVGAVAKLLSRHTTDARDLVGKLDDKLIALARAQDLLTVRRDEPIAASEAVEQVLADSGAGDRIEIGTMPEARLSDEAVQQLALLLGELQTNSLKHGALRAEAGRIDLSGRREGKVLTLRWREDCGHRVAPVEKGAGGFQLIRRLGAVGAAQPAISWQSTGIEVEFHLRALG